MIANSPPRLASRALFVLVTMAVACASTPCRADGTASNAAVAEALFREGKELIRAGKISEGCARLAESQRLDPGGGTLLTLATCHEQEGRTATAYLEFKESLAVARQAGRGDRAELAQQHIHALEPKLSSLTVTVPTASDAPGLVVAVDGASLVRAAWGSSVPSDPGKHVVEAHAPGHAPWRSEVDVGPSADRRVVTVPPLAAAPVEVAARESPAAATTPEQAPPAPTHAIAIATAPSSTRRTVGYVVGGAGIAALGAATFFGLKAISASRDAKADGHCDARGCDAAGVSSVSDAHSAARVANVTAAVGVVAVGTSLVLFLTNLGRGADAPVAGPAPSARVRIDVGASCVGALSGGMLQMSGRF